MPNDKRIVAGLDDGASIAEMRQRHLKIGIRMQAVAASALAELEAKQKVGKPLGVTAEDAEMLMKAGTELERPSAPRRRPH